MCFKVLQGFDGVKHRKKACLPCVEAGGLVAFQHPTTAVSNLPPTADGLTQVPGKVRYVSKISPEDCTKWHLSSWKGIWKNCSVARNGIRTKQSAAERPSVRCQACWINGMILAVAEADWQRELPFSPAGRK